MIILDTEATSLTVSPVLPLAQQPYVIEITALKVTLPTDGSRGWPVPARYSTLVRPPVPVPAECTKITKLTTEDLAGAPSFVKVYGPLVDFVLGERILLAHNLPYDVAVVDAELQRMEKARAFPWPPVQICTVEATQYLTGKYLKLTELYEALFGVHPTQEHRASSDADMLLVCAQELWRQGRLDLPVSAP